MNKNFTEEEFNKWRQEWFEEKGCPFFACSQALFRKVCGKTFICGSLFDYAGYKKDKWIKVCDVKLEQDEEGKFPTKSCPACMGAMSLKTDSETGTIYSDSWCPVINNWYEASGIKVIHNNEKYSSTWGVYVLPLIGEKAYLEMLKDPNKFKAFMENPDEFRETEK
jgi:hypothetical protein